VDSDVGPSNTRTLYFRGTGVIVSGEGTFNLNASGDQGAQQIQAGQDFRPDPPTMVDYRLTANAGATVTQVEVQSVADVAQDV
jgi:hypothetical protein